MCNVLFSPSHTYVHNLQEIWKYVLLKNNHNFPKSNFVLPKFYQHLKKWIYYVNSWATFISSGNKQKTHQNLSIYRNKGILESLGKDYPSDIFWATFLN